MVTETEIVISTIGWDANISKLATRGSWKFIRAISEPESGENMAIDADAKQMRQTTAGCLRCSVKILPNISNTLVSRRELGPSGFLVKVITASIPAIITSTSRSE